MSISFHCKGWGRILTAAIGGMLLARSEAAQRVDFNRDIRPVLSDNCFACHGPDSQKVKGRLRLDVRELALQPAKSGKVAVVPGKPQESELLHRLASTDADEVMPPPESHKSLTATQKDLLRRWIAEGAEYQGHWAYIPPVRPEVVGGPGAIDELVKRRLDGLGLKPSPEADRRILVRRLYMDLMGLPPRPDEVAAFEKDASPEAYERLVDRLIASPRFGERMAIGWLDVVRFADTIGYHSDNPRNIWPYRDYVIRSFNANKPFDQFTREQLAGDLLPNPTLEQKVASGFNRLLLTTEEGGAQDKDYLARYMTDRIRAIGTVWMGQTLGCAQCHDHKFDPITSRDFYSMGAFFADIKEAVIGRREDGELVPSEEQSSHLSQLDAEVKRLQQQFDGAHPELEKSFLRWQLDQLAALNLESRWTSPKLVSAKATGEAQLKTREDRSVLVSGPNPDKDTYTLRLDSLPGKTVGIRLEVLPDGSLPSKGPGRAGNGNFVLTEVVARVERPGAESRVIAFQTAWASLEQTTLVDKNPYGRWSAASVIDGDAKGTFAGWAVLPEVGKAHQLRLGFREPLTLSAEETLVLELQQNHENGGHNLGSFRLTTTIDPESIRPPVSALPSTEIAGLVKIPIDQRNATQQQKLLDLYKAQAPELASLRGQLAAARKALTEFEATIPRTLVTVRSESPRPIRILPRGNWLVETGDIVSPAFPAAFKVQVNKPKDQRLDRLDLANWLVSADNPLTSRVIMNRTWRQFFGSGLSKVLDDFGAQGETPRNQALLDWLACEFRDSGWDLKHMVRLMVLSQTYRQVSTASKELLARDPDNRELARQGRWRVEAELVRDNALSLSGLLIPVIGGPSAKPYQPEGYWENLNFPQRSYDHSMGANQYRRGLYNWWQRSYVHPSMLAFDAATREECAAERNRSNIPQQALVLLNDPSYVEAARAFAIRILQECSGDDTARLKWAWNEALSRNPRPEELQTLKQLLQSQRQGFRQDPTAASRYLSVGLLPVPAQMDSAELAAWTDIARAILNLHETITRS